ncbi:MAG TPA: hypothetical protein VJC08_02380 [bacterium]|nr:hypothetical protein [bacterium]
MKSQSVLAFFISIAVLFSSVPLAHAELLAARALTLTQGEFALAILQEAHAIDRLKENALGQDAIDFLTSLGIIPHPDGWDANKPVDEAFLRSLVQDSPAGASLEEIIQSIVSAIESSILFLPAEQNVNSGSTGPS